MQPLLPTPQATATPATPTLDGLPTCQQEDGNPDGAACAWTDPDTGTRYRVDSADYD
ncbi:hypothetical protein [Mycolicibacterium sarraceniae]|uniref:Uncharacterized protein n=1 Tax=Mycolicibacterium sarraceniae TaxID=1534348 RepID=A0A7I7SWA9_9MYCO|nr:hypothetical protein [Mycolicibacterium sarraceniae]BBY60325.1 hypothetical protein MSAR_34610 [Mycolicibacterium sarraceniae]